MSRTPRATQDAVVEEFSRLAPRYDEKWSFYVEATTRETLARLRVRPADRVLDIGCGTGVLLERLQQSQPQAKLTGIDPVAQMLAIARRRLAPSTELLEGWAEHLPFEDASFDVVVSCNVFHYIREPMLALREMKRVLRRGGRLVITDWCDDYLACRLCDWYLRLFSAARVKVYGERECRHMLEQAGHGMASVERYKISWLWGLMTATATNV